ncbi:MAG: hypothetical protein ABSA15_02565 [Thermoplasmata archaeon]|jgi:hypothetical protein
MGEWNDECGRGPTQGPWAWSAYRAYNELLREKIKKQFEAQEGPWMDQLAKLLVELVNARWEGGRKGEKDEAEIVAKLDRLLAE